MVEKKYIKIGIAATAAVALVIGLSVGITQSKARNTSASSAMDLPRVDWNDCDAHHSGKAGKSGAHNMSATSGKSGKSGGNSMSMGKSGKSGGDSSRRRLIVPGTENFKYEETSQRRTLRDSLNNGELLYFS